MSPQWSECKESRIVLGETPACAEIFDRFLQYFYTGHICVDAQTVMPILTLADKYNLKVETCFFPCHIPLLHFPACVVLVMTFALLIGSNHSLPEIYVSTCSICSHNKPVSCMAPIYSNLWTY